MSRPGWGRPQLSSLSRKIRRGSSMRLEDGSGNPASKWLTLAHGLARLLAACPRFDLRDGARALELALAVQAALESLEHSETVAMALAQSGRISRRPADWQLAVLERAQAEASAETVTRLRDNLLRYESGEPCCCRWSGGL